MAEAPLLDIRRLSLGYDTARGRVQALDGVTLAIPRGAAMGLVGESGSGKSSVVLALLGLLGPEAVLAADRLDFAGEDLRSAAPRLRGARIGTVFQDPAAALNPALRIGLQVAEPLVQHRGLSPRAAHARAVELLAEMGIPRPAAVAEAYPHQLSGGMKQRAVIATALACEPEQLLLDEPTTALDVTVEAQILDLLERLRAERGVSMLLVSHNLGIVDRLCDGLTVLYAGRVVESGATEALLAAPRHPYTRGLLAALPRADRGRIGRLAPIPGNLPDLT
ncbi:MAG: ABC transporter ATP-binding protein, partial [Acetobacteraceae bacterium]|nr:ABC transporter ATP-binding protein [Acetobacteraceae bacterium]